jgi:tetratricopeptide (TPR) repeat protein
MYLSICLIAKDENVYLKEWLDYHILLGVEHFWIYDNDSKVPLEETINTYVKKGWVTINRIHGRAVQLYAYDHCIQEYGQFSQWIGFIDTDEFIVPKTTPHLKNFLRDYETYAGLSISSLFYGSGGNQTRPGCGQIIGYQMRTPEALSKNRFIKSIVQPDKVVFPISPHSFMYKEGEFCVNENNARVDSQFFPCYVAKIQLNHYYTRSAQEWKEKKIRGRGDSGDPYEDDAWVDLNKNSSIHDDTAIQRIIPQLKLPPSLARNFTALADPLTTKFVDEMSAATGMINPIDCPANPSVEIPHRLELEQLLADYSAGIRYVAEKQYDRAKKTYAGLIQKYPFDVTQYTNFAISCIHLGDLQSAWEALAQAWRMAPKSFMVLQCMNDYFFAAGNFEQVEKICHLMESYGNLEPINVAGMALAQWEQGKYDQARLTASGILPQLTPQAVASHKWYQRIYDLMVKPDMEKHDTE